MLALYRAGRQTDALDAFRSGARDDSSMSSDSSPGPSCTSSSAGSSSTIHRSERRAPSFRPSGSRQPSDAGAVSAVLALAASSAGSCSAPALRAGGLRCGRGQRGRGGGHRSGPDCRRRRRCPGPPSAAATGAGSVWVAGRQRRDGLADRSAQRRASIDRIPVGGDPASIASGDGAIWVANTVGATVASDQPNDRDRDPDDPLGGANPDALAFGAGRLWVADSSTRALYEVDPSDRRLACGRSRSTCHPSAIVVRGGCAVGRRLRQRDGPESSSPTSGTGRSHACASEPGPASLAFAAGDLWVANSLDSTVSRIDPATPQVRATIPVGSGPSAVIAADGSVWVANQYSGSVSRIDPRRDAVVATVASAGCRRR